MSHRLISVKLLSSVWLETNKSRLTHTSSSHSRQTILTLMSTLNYEAWKQILKYTFSHAKFGVPKKFLDLKKKEKVQWKCFLKAIKSLQNKMSTSTGHDEHMSGTPTFGFWWAPTPGTSGRIEVSNAHFLHQKGLCKFRHCLHCICVN